MQLANKLAELVRACFTGIWIESHEHQGAMTEIAQLCRQEDWRLAAWDIERGLHIPGQSAPAAADTGGQDPLAAKRPSPGRQRDWACAIMLGAPARHRDHVH